MYLIHRCCDDNAGMGLFSSRPAETTTWGSIPGEPLDRLPGDQLPDDPAVDPTSLDPVSADGVASVSISIDLTPAVDTLPGHDA